MFLVKAGLIGLPWNIFQLIVMELGIDEFEIEK